MKHVVITGANRGIGLELARHYHSEGWQTTGICRESSVELGEVAKQIIEGIDLTSRLCCPIGGCPARANHRLAYQQRRRLDG